MYQSRKIIQVKGFSGGRRVDPEECSVNVLPGDVYALVTYKTMAELLKENPNAYFDCYGNFNNGRTTENGYSMSEGAHDHLAPSYFAQMGHTLHRRYDPADGIPKDTWYYSVIDY